MRSTGKLTRRIPVYAGVAMSVLGLSCASYIWVKGSELDRRLAALRAEGMPVKLADLGGESIPPETNADTFLRRAEADLESVQKDLMTLYPKTVYPVGAVSPDDREKLEMLFAAHPEVMPLLEQAAACPKYEPQIDASLSPLRFLDPYMKRTGGHRTLVRVLRAHSALRSAQGRPDDALATQLLALRLTRKWCRDPLLIGYLVTLACASSAMEGVNQILQNGPVTPASRQALDAELARLDDLEGLLWSLRTERAYALSTFQEQFASTIWPPRFFTDGAMLGLLDLFDHQIESSARPYAEAVSPARAFSPREAFPSPYQSLVMLLAPSLASARQAADRNRALVRSLRILNAVQARAGLNDRAPDVADLGLPTDATVDPFSGDPLHFKKRPEGWTVYSVGPDGVDDGGTLDGKSDFGFGPIGREPEESPVQPPPVQQSGTPGVD